MSLITRELAFQYQIQNLKKENWQSIRALMTMRLICQRKRQHCLQTNIPVQWQALMKVKNTLKLNHLGNQKPDLMAHLEKNPFLVLLKERVFEHLIWPSELNFVIFFMWNIDNKQFCKSPETVNLNFEYQWVRNQKGRGSKIADFEMT